MIVKYRIISGEDESFVRDIEIYSDNTFLDLHLAIQASCDYDQSLLTTFYMSNKAWDKGQEIILTKMDEEVQSDTLVMEETKLSDIKIHLGQRIIYIYDFFSIRAFFIEVVNIREARKEDKNLEFPICTLSHSKAPMQIFIDDLTETNFEEGYDEEIDDDLEELGFDNIDNYDI